MKKIFLSLILLAATVSLNAQPGSTVVVKSSSVDFQPAKRMDAATESYNVKISGKVEYPVEDMEVTVSRPKGFERNILATVPVRDDGTYEIVLTTDIAGSAVLHLTKTMERPTVWIEDEDLTVDFTGIGPDHSRIAIPVYARIHGGPKNAFMDKLYWEIVRHTKTQSEVATAIYEQESLSEEMKQTLFGAANKALTDDCALRIEYLLDNFGDVASAMAAFGRLPEGEVRTRFMEQYEARNPGYAPWLVMKAEMEQERADERRIATGQPAPPFSYETPDGKRKLGPADFRGKILVIDFWASWCGPCRAEIPHLKKAYERFKDKGVEIFSVSLDRDDTAWRKAMQEENMPWPQAKAPDAGREVMELYRFQGIPHIVFLTPDGNIIGKNFRGQALIDKLEELTSGK